ncbi:MAG: cache domain-containing sensor histidine kinase [Cellulosilyticaceae bacterium]
MPRLKCSFSTKLFITNTVIIVLSLLSILFYFYNFLKEKESLQLTQNLQTLNTKLTEQTDTLIDNMDKITLQIASNPYILGQFTQLPKDQLTNYFDEDHFLRFDLRDFLNSYNFKNDLATRICLYDRFGNFVDVGYKPTDTLAVNNFFQSKDFTDVITFFQHHSHKSFFIPPRKDPFSLTSSYSSSLYTLSIVRPIKNYRITDNTIAGYVEVQLDSSALDALFTSLGPSITAFMIDGEGKIIYPITPEPHYFDYETVSDDHYLITSQSMTEVDYHIILMQNKDILFSSYKNFQYMIIFIFLIVFLISSLSQFLLITYFTNPLKKLQHSVTAINLDNLSLELLDESVSDEFVQLGNAFNKMFEHLNISIQHTIFARTSELKSHLLALQAQINPHFIHNVLSVMSVTAEENDVPKLADMCEKLSSMLRFSSSYTQTHVTLEEELSYTRSYLELMKDRYEDLFTFDLQIDGPTDQIRIPKLIIQPLAENCFNHGFKQKPSPWHIAIHFFVKDGYWLVTISDNGVGFPDGAIEAFENHMIALALADTAEELTKLQIGGLSLTNLFLRLHIMYKSYLIFKLENNPCGGATITLGGLINDVENNGGRG